MINFKKSLLLLIFPALLISCSEDKDSSPKPSKQNLEKENLFTAQYIKVSDEKGNALPKVNILIGQQAGDFVGNQLITDSQGFALIPETWLEEKPVTAKLEGYVSTTYLRQKPGALQFNLRKNPSTQRIELKGTTTGHSLKNYDNDMDAGLVMSAMNRRDIMSFKLEKVLSPEMDTIAVMGYEMQIPSNSTIPRQKENYIIPVTIDKALYRIYYPEPGVYKIYAARGHFPFKTMVDELRNEKQFYELINYFEITSGTLKDVALVNATNSFDFNITEMKFTDKKDFVAPTFSSNHVVVSVAISETQGALLPTDLKKLNPQQKVTLSLLPNVPAHNLSVLKNANEFDPLAPGTDRLSLHLQAFNSGISARFLPLVADPHYAAGKITFERPQNAIAIQELASYISIASIKDANQNLYEYWDIYSPIWETEMALPAWISPNLKKIEMSYLGSDSNSTVNIGPEVMEKANYVSRSSKSL